MRGMRKIIVNILALCETRMAGGREMHSDHYRIIYSGENKHEKGVGILLDILLENEKTVKGYMPIAD